MVNHRPTAYPENQSLNRSDKTQVPAEQVPDDKPGFRRKTEHRMTDCRHRTDCSRLHCCHGHLLGSPWTLQCKDRQTGQSEGASQKFDHRRRGSYHLFSRSRYADRYGPQQQGGRLSRSTGLLTVGPGLRRQGGESNPEHHWQYLRRPGRRRDGQDPFGAVRKGASEAPVDQYDQGGYLDQYLYPARLADPGLEDFQPESGHVRRLRIG